MRYEYRAWIDMLDGVGPELVTSHRQMARRRIADHTDLAAFRRDVERLVATWHQERTPSDLEVHEDDDPDTAPQYGPPNIRWERAPVEPWRPFDPYDGAAS